jgi:hypothetical protein
MVPFDLRDASSFLPPADALPAEHGFSGRLTLPETPMELSPPDVGRAAWFNARVDLFPASSLGFVSRNGYLAPVAPMAPPLSASSYWRIAVGTGRVWTERGSPDRSVAAFPFALFNPLEGESHVGLARFSYDASSVGPVEIQIVQRTTPYLLERSFAALGTIEARYEPADLDLDGPTVRAHRDAAASALPWRSWDELAPIAGTDTLDRVAGPLADSAIVHALVVDGTVYAQPCRSDCGPFPYPEEMLFGVWSVTKSAFAMLSMLRLAQKYGDDVGSLPIADLVRVTAEHDGWKNVTIRDCLDMATGIGDAGLEPDPPDLMADYDEALETGPFASGAYRDWYLARSAREKLDAAFACGSYPWGPGFVARYRDQDIFMAAAAMDAVVKDREGPDASLLALTTSEVFDPIGVRSSTVTATQESDGRTPLPVSSFGLLVTIPDMIRIATLLQRGGAFDGRQLLSSTMTSEVLGRSGPEPRPTGQTTVAGEYGYRNTMWFAPYEGRSGPVRVPCMLGYGGNAILLLPNGMIGLRCAHDPETGDGESWDPTALIRVADEIRTFP